MGAEIFDLDRIGGAKTMDSLKSLILRAGDLALKHFERGVEVHEKPDRSPVTQADHEVEALIRESLLREFPDAEFFGEESGSHGENAALRFILDPIDGTRAFVRNLPTWSILLGVEVEGESIAGLAYMPAREELFVAARDQGSSCNGRALRVSEVAKLKDAMVSHGALQQFQAAGLMDALARLAEATDSARGFADFEGYRQLLLGRVDAMVDPDVKPYDICAPAVLVREAGGRFSAMDGADTIYGGGAIASNGRVHDALVATLRAS